MRNALTVAAAYVAGVATTTLLGSIVQTQFNLAELQALGAPAPLDVRLQATLADLAGFTPTYGAVMGVALLIAFVVSGLLARALPGMRTALHVLAGGTAVVAAILVMIQLFGITPIAAARDLPGFAALALCGALGGWVFSLVAAARQP